MTPHERLEQATWDLAWVPPGTRVVDRPELLALGCERDVSYLNVVLRTRATSEQLPCLIDEVTVLHAGRTSRWTVADTVALAPLERGLADAGYVPGQTHDARLIDLSRCASRATSIEVRRVADESTLRDCWAVNDAAFGPTEHRAEDVAIELAACSHRDASVQRFVGYLGRTPVSSGGINFYPRLDIALLWGGGTVQSERGRGAYGAVLAARLELAKRRGVAYAGLYARTDTASPIVAKLGFERHGVMTYYTKDLIAESTRVGGLV